MKRSILAEKKRCWRTALPSHLGWLRVCRGCRGGTLFQICQLDIQFFTRTKALRGVGAGTKRTGLLFFGNVPSQAFSCAACGSNDSAQGHGNGQLPVGETQLAFVLRAVETNHDGGRGNHEMNQAQSNNDNSMIIRYDMI